MNYSNGFSRLAIPLLAAIAGCMPAMAQKAPAKELSLNFPAQKELKDAARQYAWFSTTIPADSFPKSLRKDGSLESSASHWWCSGFYPGALLYLYEATSEAQLKAAALQKLDPLEREQYNVNTHDVGFMMYDSYGHANRLFPSEHKKQVLVNSARSLATRFSPITGCIRSWNSKPDEFLVIIDNMMNLELLFYATRVTGDSSFYKIAVTHANTTMREHFRADNSSYHVVSYNPTTGKAQEKRTRQGYSNASAWARGQGWGLYGYTVMYRETKDPRYLEQANKIARYILDHPRLPADKVPYWDFDAPGIPKALRDASAGSLIASALLELAACNEGALRNEYLHTAEKILTTLSSPQYKAAYRQNGGFLLKHSVGFLGGNSEVDVPLSYADYYYVEALWRYRQWQQGKPGVQPMPAIPYIAADGRRIIAPIDPERVKQIAAMLPEKPKGFGTTYKDRRSWDSLYRTGLFKALIADAEKIRKEPLPPLTDEIYLSFFEGKDSETSKKLMTQRRLLVACLVWAECLVNDGRYMPAIETGLRSLCEQKSWNFPAEDRTRSNFNGTRYTINLGPAAYGHEIAQAAYMLDDKLSAATKKLIEEALDKFVFKPTHAAINDGGKTDIFGSLAGTNNHNAATLAGVTGAALAAIADKKERAFFVAVAERYSYNSMVGFLEDGYCTEGLDYYNYGFEHYINLRENLYQATNGKIDILKEGGKIKKIGRFAPNLEILNGVYPAIGDCKQYPKPSSFLLYYVNRNLGLGLTRYDQVKFYSHNLPPLNKVVQVFPNTASQVTVTSLATEQANLRYYFDRAGVLISRPAAGSAFQLGAAFKGGHNKEHHNHNDVGSYTIVVDEEIIMGDPGLSTYTPKTFSPERYSAFKSIASYGHPVPLVAGTQQKEGAAAKAVITATQFTDTADRIVMDITSAYPVPALTKLERTFTYQRTEAYIDAEDNFSFNQPQAYETAVITRARWKLANAGTILLQGEKSQVQVTIDTGGLPFTIVSEVIDEGKGPYTRLAIRLREPVSTGKIKLRYQTISSSKS